MNKVSCVKIIDISQDYARIAISMEFLDNILPIFQVAVSLVVIALVLVQTGSEGGLGGAFGGAESSGAFKTKRGFEKVLFYTTIVAGILFALSALIALIIQ